MSSGSRNKPARRPAEMATADSPKDSEPPTVSGMPSKFGIPHFAKNVKRQFSTKKPLTNRAFWRIIKIEKAYQ